MGGEAHSPSNPAPPTPARPIPLPMATRSANGRTRSQSEEAPGLGPTNGRRPGIFGRASLVHSHDGARPRQPSEASRTRGRPAGRPMAQNRPLGWGPERWSWTRNKPDAAEPLRRPRRRSCASPPRSSSGACAPWPRRSCWRARASPCASTSRASSPARARPAWPRCACPCSTTRLRTCWRTWSPPAPPWRPRCAPVAPVSSTARTAAAARPLSAPPTLCVTAASAWRGPSRP